MMYLYPKRLFLESYPNDFVSAKITPRSEYQSEIHGGVLVSEPQFVPGLDLATARTTNYQQLQTESRRAPTHDAYVEDRVLTPSRFRRPSKPWSDPSSPRREFGTQTNTVKVNESTSELFDGLYHTY